MSITKQLSSLATVCVGVITAAQYPPLFCQAFIQVLEQKVGLQKTLLGLDDQLSWVSLESALRTTFLGQKKLCWFGSIGEYDAATKKKLATLLATYQGPHHVWLFVPEKDLPLFTVESTVMIKLDSLATTEKVALKQAVYGASAASVMGKKNAQLSWDQEHVMAGYAAVLGKNTEQFMNTWYDKIIQPDESLFTLAQAFFARRPDTFFPLWNAVKHEYVGVFWTSFWSDQIWRAYYVIQLRHQEKATQAQQLSFRLPFSFLQRDWKAFSLDELQRAHQFLYDADCALKNGASEECIDVFCTAFVLKQI